LDGSLKVAFENPFLLSFLTLFYHPVENESHCEFVALRNFLTRTHLQDLIDVTAMYHYENFRTKQLLALKESTAVAAAPAAAPGPSA
jgi:septin 3/9/12